MTDRESVEKLAEYTENMVGMEFTEKRRREVLSIVGYYDEDQQR